MSTDLCIDGARPYRDVIGRDILPGFGTALREVCHGARCCLVSDDTVQALYGDTVAASLQTAGYAVSRFSFPPGEQSKRLSTVECLLEFLAAEGLDRGDCLAALGGGVCGDLAGFAASVYQRGIAYAQLPTTLIAMADSAVGGKTGVDLAAGKNLAGTFHDPLLVYTDVACLSTLPEAQRRYGLAECVKAAVVGDTELFALLQTDDSDAAMTEIIRRAVAVKARLVAADAHDHGARRLLNLGHTIGHALEVRSDYALHHGQAVAIGLAAAARAATAHGMAAAACCHEIIALLQRFALPTDSPYPLAELLPLLTADKKRRGGELTLILPQAIACCCCHTLPLAATGDFLSPAFPGGTL